MSDHGVHCQDERPCHSNRAHGVGTRACIQRHCLPVTHDACGNKGLLYAPGEYQDMHECGLQFSYCHGVMPKWLRQSGGVVRCTKQWKADGQSSSGLSQVREQRVMGAFLIVLGNGTSMKIKYNRKVLRLLKDLIRRILTEIRSQYP